MNITSQKFACIASIVLGLLAITILIVGAIGTENAPTITNTVPCHDENNNEINELTCTEITKDHWFKEDMWSLLMLAGLFIGFGIVVYPLKK